MSGKLHYLNLNVDPGGTDFAEASRRAAILGALEARSNPKLHNPRMNAREVMHAICCEHWRVFHQDSLLRLYRDAFQSICYQYPRPPAFRLHWYHFDDEYECRYYVKPFQFHITIDSEYGWIILLGKDVVGQGHAASLATAKRDSRKTLIEYVKSAWKKGKSNDQEA